VGGGGWILHYPDNVYYFPLFVSESASRMTS
jgi:hypothetical protein